MKKAGKQLTIVQVEEQHLPETTVNEIDQLINRVEKYLLNPDNVAYFKINPEWLHEDQLSGFNEEQLSHIASKSGVYAIWVKTITDTCARYIGHTAGATARIRIINHFFKKHPRTGSQLTKVKQAVTDGAVVGFTFVALHPPLIRLYVESAMIARHHRICTWNIHSKGKIGKVQHSAQ